MRNKTDFDYYYDESDEIENEYLTVYEIMNLLYIGRSSAYKLLRSGQLPAFRVGKLWRISKKELELFIENNNRADGRLGR